uniref:Uncharacterized protein n=1 Tax=Gasterosteus aculeatus TaxID=69293 RepID=G3NLN9_GASAC
MCLSVFTCVLAPPTLTPPYQCNRRRGGTVFNQDQHTPSTIPASSLIGDLSFSSLPPPPPDEIRSFESEGLRC